MAKKFKSQKKKKFLDLFGSYTLLIILSLVWLLPFVGILLQSFRSFATEYGAGGMVEYLVPKQFSLDNYTYLFTEGKFLKWYGIP